MIQFNLCLFGKNEIYKGLETMDGFISFITNDYYESTWTNQEIGYALAKGIPFFQYSHDGTDPDGFKSEIQAIKSGEIELRYFIKKAFTGNELLKKGILENFIDAKDGTFAGAKSKFNELLGFQFTDREIDELVATINGPAKYINQLICLLSDEAPSLLGDKYPAGTPYRKILENEILNQHSQKRYSINKVDEHYKICDNLSGEDDSP